MAKINFKDFYEPPYYSDGIYIWSNNGNMALMIDDIEKDCDALLHRICTILNGEQTPNKVPDLIYNAPDIILNGSPFLVVRGWSTLMSDEYTESEATQIQDDFAKWVISKLTEA